MIKTYYIVGYAVVEPFLNNKLREVIKSNPSYYDNLPKSIKLIFVNDQELRLKSIFRLSCGVVYHKFSKRTNWYKFSHALFRRKDHVKIYMTDFKEASNFVEEYISFNTITKKWVFASYKDRKKLKVNYELVKQYIEMHPSIIFYLTEKEINNIKKLDE